VENKKSLRILAGRLKGKRLDSPPGDLCRPTLSRIRQTLFDILAPYLHRSTFLDLFAGCGSVGLEAVSQGCRHVVMVEQDPLIGSILMSNRKRIDPLGQQTEIILHDGQSALHQLVRQKQRFDFIFLDPPYGSWKSWEAILASSLSPLLTPGGWIIYQHDHKESLPASWGEWIQLQHRRFGRTHLHFYGVPT
jgi:16S rRNA (guanine966-N2)-methyltransferase